MASDDSCKKKRVSGVEENEDRISELHDSLLLHILSLLPTTEDAYKTCVLSKRWRYLWTSLHTLSFIFYYYDEKFVTFVDYVLAHSISSKIKTFKLDIPDPDEYESEISRWISFAVEKKVEDFVLWPSCNVNTCPLPKCFYTCSSLITLFLGSCYFDADVVVAWKSLKSLMVINVVLSDDRIVNILSGCPALEMLELNYFEGFNRLEIRSSKLKRLHLRDYIDDGKDNSLDIIAPYLQHLEISGRLYDLRCRLVDVSSLVNAKITFNIRCVKDIRDEFGQEFDEAEDSCRDYHQVFRTLVQDYLQKFSCATELTVGTWFTQVLCMLQFKGVPFPELKCKYLTLEVHMEKFNLYGVAGLLRASPHVETLNIDIATIQMDDSCCLFEIDDLAEGDNIDLQSWISSYAFPKLKNVKIVISSRMCLKQYLQWAYVKKLFKLSEFLLMNASVLEKFVIISKRRCKTCSMNCVYQYLFPLAQKLLGCPRSSTNSVILFQE